MGTFIRTYGIPSIPEDKLPEFRARTLAIADQGGMMTLSHITMFGRHLTLLAPAKLDEDGSIDFYYSYFEGECWENAGFSSKQRHLFSNKIGRRTFNGVMRALYILQELYSEAPCISKVDGQLFDARDELGWLNYRFNARFTNERVCHPWKTYASFRGDGLTSGDALSLAFNDLDSAADSKERTACIVIGKSGRFSLLTAALAEAGY